MAMPGSALGVDRGPNPPFRGNDIKADRLHFRRGRSWKVSFVQHTKFLTDYTKFSNPSVIVPINAFVPVVLPNVPKVITTPAVIPRFNSLSFHLYLPALLSSS